ncbi:MAG TPA: chloride channel protein [Ktedonobacterales bacterium]
MPEQPITAGGAPTAHAPVNRSSAARIPDYFNSDIGHTIQLTLAAIPMGGIGALAAWALYHLIMIFTGLAFYGELTLKAPIYPPASGLGIKALIVPVAGALLVGLMARYGAERIRGHGIPEAMEAVLTQGSRISARVALFKPISAAIAVGTGGPFGAEGPIIQTGGAIGSLIGQAFHLTASERRTLLACGAAAGMVGIFNTPMAAVALALELLLFEFRVRSLAPVIVAAAVAAACRPLLLGGAVMFHVTAPIAYSSPLSLIWLAPLGVLVGIAAALISRAFFLIEGFFDRLPVSMIFKPAIGAFVLGLVALVEPRVLGMGYLTITHTLNGDFSSPALLLLGLGKTVGLLFSLGSGTSGGLLAPMLLIGAALGVGYGRGVALLAPGMALSPALCGVVAMSGLFSSAARAPLTSFLFAFELTGNYHAVAPLMIGCMFAEVTARALNRESIMTGRLVQRGVRAPEHLEPHPLSALRVSDVMSRATITVPADLPLAAVLRTLSEPQSHSLRWALPVVTVEGALVGMTTRGALLQAARDETNAQQAAREFATIPAVSAQPDDALTDAVERMLDGDYGLLPVVSTDGEGRLVGILTRGDILRADLRRREHDRRRERFLGASRPAPSDTPVAQSTPEDAVR